jgi:hypothetical protein
VNMATSVEFNIYLSRRSMFGKRFSTCCTFNFWCFECLSAPSGSLSTALYQFMSDTNCVCTATCRDSWQLHLSYTLPPTGSWPSPTKRTVTLRQNPPPPPQCRARRGICGRSLEGPFINSVWEFLIPPICCLGFWPHPPRSQALFFLMFFAFPPFSTFFTFHISTLFSFFPLVFYFPHFFLYFLNFSPFFTQFPIFSCGNAQRIWAFASGPPQRSVCLTHPPTHILARERN